MTKSWVSGGKGTEAIDKLRLQVTELETRRDELVEKNKRQVFDWSSFILSSNVISSTVRELRDHQTSHDVKEILAMYEMLNQQILDKEALLNEKLDEQARYDSLG
jgi:capsular polysaccharide biosynthesis protein